MFCPECGKKIDAKTVIILQDSDGNITYDIHCAECGTSGWWEPDEEAEE